MQTIIQYSLNKQRSTAKVVNLAGKQRAHSQRLLNELYSCRYHNCDYADLKLTLNKLYQMHNILREGSEHLGFDKLTDKAILANFDKLDVHANWLYSKLGDLKKLDQVSFNDMRYHVDRFMSIMDGIVLQFQKKSEADIKAMRVVEMELAILSVVIVLFEILFIVNPIINRILKQKKKLEEIAWHQSHAFSSHMKNVKDLQYVLKAERIPERRQEIVKFISEELDKLKEVSNNMVKALAKNEQTELPHRKVIKKMGNLLDKLQIDPAAKVTDDDKVHS